MNWNKEDIELVEKFIQIRNKGYYADGTQLTEVYNRVLMQIYQLRNEASKDIGNKAIIDEIAPGKKVSLLFDSEELKSTILFSEANPTQKGFQVDVKVQTINGKFTAYKVIALHDIIDLEI